MPDRRNRRRLWERAAALAAAADPAGMAMWGLVATIDLDEELVVPSSSVRPGVDAAPIDTAPHPRTLPV